MDDEEERLFGEKNDRNSFDNADANEERGKKIAEITDVKFLDKDGKEKNVFETGTDLSVRVYFKIYDKTKKVFNFGFGLYSSNSQYLFGISTVADNIDTTKNINNGFFDVYLKNVNLLTDSYYIKASIVGSNFSAGSVYTYIERSPIFKIISNAKVEGVLKFEHTWK